ncbi:MAG: class I SAM-dependent methyltransferase [Allosphingosinicella sp.]|uniref:class I SAM-dependent methyltransferase n=1 Tax=Allosphingosinicella sp. TaxID=2823234 RepID=UPI003956497D
MTAHYDTIGLNYAELRKPDERIAEAIRRALGPARTVLNVGAGAGSYEPADRQVTALEPSIEMIRQRPASAATVVQGRAEELPFEDKSFDASMAVLTVHHWSDQAKGLSEIRRVTRGPVVILTYDPSFRGFWLADYIPELVALDEAQMPPLSTYERWLGAVATSPVPIPHDCSDGFLCAYWRRPAAYLDPRVRAAISSFWALGDVSQALARLEQDLASGAWAEGYGHLLGLDSCDCGYRLIVAE